MLRVSIAFDTVLLFCVTLHTTVSVNSECNHVIDMSFISNNSEVMNKQDF